LTIIIKLEKQGAWFALNAIDILAELKVSWQTKENLTRKSDVILQKTVEKFYYQTLYITSKIAIPKKILRKLYI